MTAPMNCPRCHRPGNAAIVLRGHRFMACEADLMAWSVGPLAGVAAMSEATAARVFDSPDALAVAAREAAEAELSRFTLVTPSKGS